MATQIPLLQHQLDVLKAREKEVLLLGGIGAGKSLTGAHWLLNKIVEFPKCDLMICANTYSQLMNASVKTFTNLLDDLGIAYNAVLSGARKRIEVGYNTIYLYSLDKPDSIRGIEIAFSWLDEVAFSTLEALNVVRGRMRGQFADYRQILMTTSGNGFNFLYDIFGNMIDDTKRLISAKTKDNIFLPEGYYDELVDNYGGENTDLAQQELFGKFVNLQAGAIYNMFDRKINVKSCQLDKNYPVYVGVDYNIDQMSATYIQFIQGTFYQCNEVSLEHRNANTFDLSDRILDDLKDFKEVFIIPDSTGRARSSKTSGKSDHQIMREKGLIVMETSNPLIRDRQNNLNILFRKELLVVDPSCVKTIKEIETLNSRQTEGLVSHLSVTTGYVTWKLAPLKRPTPKQKHIKF